MRGEEPPDPEFGWAAIRAVADEVGQRVDADRTSGCAAPRTPSRRCWTGRVWPPVPVVSGSRRGDRGLLTSGPMRAGRASGRARPVRWIAARLERILAPWSGGRSEARPSPSRILSGAVIAGHATRAGARGSGPRIQADVVVGGAIVARVVATGRRRWRTPGLGPSIEAAGHRHRRARLGASGPPTRPARARGAARGRRGRRRWGSTRRAGQGPSPAAEHRLPRRARGPGLRPGQPLRRRARDRRGLLRALPPASARPPARHRHRRRDRQGPRCGAADGVRPTGDAHRAQCRDRAGRGPRADEPRPGRGASRHALHHRPVRDPGPEAPAGSGSPTPGTSRRC